MTRAGTLSWVLVFGATLAACGGRQNLDPPDDDGGTGAGGAAGSPLLGPVDFSQAPTQIPMTCDHGIGAVAFVNPCEVGMNLFGEGATTPGADETECHFAGQGAPIVWSFVLPLYKIAMNPGAPLQIPDDVPSVPAENPLAELGGQEASVASVSGVLTFSRVDPTGRAFIGHLRGTVTWNGSVDATITCVVDAPFWGAPGEFL
jgi:hypothetical protein